MLEIILYIVHYCNVRFYANHLIVSLKASIAFKIVVSVNLYVAHLKALKVCITVNTPEMSS